MSILTNPRPIDWSKWPPPGYDATTARPLGNPHAMPASILCMRQTVPIEQAWAHLHCAGASDLAIVIVHEKAYGRLFVGKARPLPKGYTYHVGWIAYIAHYMELPDPETYCAHLALHAG